MPSSYTPENPYKPVEFPDGTRVKIAELALLEEFRRTWRWHNKIQPEQLAYAGQLAEIEWHGIYHGGDAIYKLKDIPGVWHQSCLLRDT